MAAAKKNTETKSAGNLKFTVARVVTLPLFKWKVDEAKYLRADGAIFLSKATGKGEQADMEPAHLMHVTNLETWQQGQVIVGEVLKGILTEEYPDDSYVGKAFEIVQTKIEGKRYKGYSVTEIQVSE